MEIKVRHFSLEFRQPFKIAAGERRFTDTVYVELLHEGYAGYGEAALPPYLPENADSVMSAIEKVSIPLHYTSDDFFNVLYHWQAECASMPALAALDIALHDLQGKMMNKPSASIYNITGEVPLTAYTIGVSSVEELGAKLREADEFQFFKLKLNGINDKETIRQFRTLSNKPFCVDINRGWTSAASSMEICNLLEDAGCIFIEQPFEKDKLNECSTLRKSVRVPVILDESVQTFSDIDTVAHSCDGINIKLAKCGGINNAYKMIEKARASSLKIFIGCMSESSCGIAGAAQIAPLADWVDLDGPLLIKNDPFRGIEYREGRITLNGAPGTGVFLPIKKP